MKRYSPLLLILALVGVLAASQAAPAASTTPATLTAFPHLSLRDSAPEEAEEAESEDEELEIEECEATAEELEFEEEDEFEEVEEYEEYEAEEECGEEGKGDKSTFVTAPAACRVRRAESSITTLPGSDKVQLTVRYLTYSPAAVSVELKLKDHKGTVAIEHTTRHLGAKGVLHLTTKLGDALMERAAKATEFDVALRAVNTPGYCGGLLEQTLKSKRPVGNARVHTAPAGG